MRFCDLFISYKIGLKNIKNTIPFTKFPFYRKVFVIFILVNTIITGLLLIFKQDLVSIVPIILIFFSMIIFFLIDSSKRNLEEMLNEHYKPYSEKRMRMINNILKQYNISIHDIEAINMLIEEAENAKIQCDYLTPVKKPLKALSAIIIPIIAFVAQRIGNAATYDEMITLAVLIIIFTLLIFSLIFALTPIAKDILYRDYNKYDELIYDLRQAKLFYSKDNKKIIYLK